MSNIVPVERIEKSIYLIRGQKVILDSDLAAIYVMPTFRFNKAVKRNKDRFPDDFMFQLTREEVDILISQNAISKPGRGGRRTLPYVFTEHGAVMAANILKSPLAVQMSVIVVRAFIKMREMLASHKDLERKLADLKSQIVISSWGGSRRAKPYAFTEQGVAMLSSVLRSKRAVQVNIEIIRTFVKLRQMLATHKDLEQKLAALETKYDKQFKVVFDAIRALMREEEKPKRKIGFEIKEPKAKYGKRRK